MRVLIVAHGVTDQSLLGGPGNVAAAHARALAARGHQIRVLTSDLVAKGVTASPTFALLGGEIDIHWIHARTIAQWPGTVGPVFSRTSPAVHKALVDVDVVHCHEWPHGLVQTTRRVARRSGIPCVVQPHGSIQRRRGPNRLLHTVADALHPLRPDDTVIVGSDREAEEVATVTANAPMLRRLLNPMPPSGLAPNAPEVVVRRRSWNLPAGHRAVLYAHRLAPNKGLDLAIRAIATLGPEIHLIVVGDDSVFPTFVQECRDLVGQLGIRDRVHFHGSVARNEIDEVVLAADIFVLPARRDTFPLMVLHALACGRPVVVTNTCQSVEELASAVLAVAPEPNALAAAIAGLDELEIDRMTRAGRALLLERFSPEGIVTQLEGIYAAALAGAPVP